MSEREIKTQRNAQGIIINFQPPANETVSNTLMIIT